MKYVSRNTETIYDLLGIGFGPSNLALAIAIEEHNTHARTEDRIRAQFLEKQAAFGWHRGMLIDDATMQVSFPKDLVTMRDPTSDYSFLYYLKEQGRLVDFLNQKTLFPLRIEFHDYFEWAAGRLAHLVDYSAEVVSVVPVTEDGEVRYFDVTSRESDGLQVRRARDICVATGMKHRLPAGAEPSQRVLHNRDLVPRVAELAGQNLRRVVVLGAGQSAAETVAYVHRAFPEAEVCAVFAKYGYTPADDSPFANRVFDPEAVDTYYQAPTEVKESLLGYHRSTNYSAVDIELIDALYRTQYQERVQGKERLRMLNVSRLRSVETDADGLRVTVEFLPTGEQQVLEADLLVYATGYQPPDPGPLLGEANALCQRDDRGELRVSRDHRVCVTDHVTAGIYLQGATEHTHGITSTLLSHTAVRVGEILDSVLSRHHKPEPARPRV
ncbi:lysine N(6)-hydroxylase/L-ornithine N(5)-oxygenase family protein [Streptomyces zagrosensis]|uniref:L-lysine N6-monooxygenase MbtG n=1 Tax=Streptomyces zagrosensis TaxID=1042984 RepID=A0A7W9UY75_9ACTN|nr:SidA/IucD/PvdA family monooxygenase [Streptomyces zagrosensis]MBB5935357.1 L-ornithine N5-oxygenase [Streptomyces zagrosensis]